MQDKLRSGISVSLLLDFYGELLTERQRELLELYYGEDLSLSEISDMTGITRQGVRAGIRKAEAVLQRTEEKLRLLERFGHAKETVGELVDALISVGEGEIPGGAEIDALVEKAKSLL